jgi:hypothetical protein
MEHTCNKSLNLLKIKSLNIFTPRIRYLEQNDRSPKQIQKHNFRHHPSIKNFIKKFYLIKNILLLVLLIY